MFDWFKTKEYEVRYGNTVLFIIMDRPNPGEGYKLDYGNSSENIRIYNKPGGPNKFFIGVYIFLRHVEQLKNN